MGFELALEVMKYMSIKNPFSLKFIGKRKDL